MYLNLLLIPFVTSLIFSIEGFKKYVWFMSIGYGLAVAGIGLALIVLALTGQVTVTAGFIVMAVLLVLYGIRLSGFLIYREAKNATYRKTLESVTTSIKSNSDMSFALKCLLWLSLSVLYVCECAPVFYRGVNPDNRYFWILGAVISAFGICFETAADLEKSAAKKKDPHSPAMTGLYRLVRCPNYLGELIFWTGIFVSGLTSNKGAGQWILGSLGYILIIFVMFSGAKRLEVRQNKNYGDSETYRHYADTTPILIPFVPLYHLVKEVKYGK